MMRVLLTTLNAKYIHANLAIRLLYSLNHQKHRNLQWKEFTIKEDKDETAAQCATFDVVAFSCYIWNIRQTLEVAKLIKEKNPGTRIVLGGPEVSYDWQDVIALPQVDYIIAGEGEIPFSEFLDKYPATDGIENLITKQNSSIFFTKTKNFDIANYAEVQPYLYDDPASLKNRVLYIETSRGCPYKCEFCLASLDNKVRYLPMTHIRQTLLYLMKHGRVIKFLDRTFNIKKDFTLDIFQFILDHHQPENVFQFEITADILHPDIIRFIKEKVPPGLFRFEIGIQTVNQKANLEVSRKQNFEKTKVIIEQLQDQIEMHLDLIVGLPLDYMDDIRHSFETVFKLRAPELQLGLLKFLKGTTMRDKAQHGFVFNPEPPYQLLESKYLSKEELQQIEALEHALEVYWNKKRAVNTLTYMSTHYSSFDFLMALGIYFKERKSFHQFSLKDVYEILEGFIREQYPNDRLMLQLLAVDYYLQHKVRPQQLIQLEMPEAEKLKVIRERNICTRNCRHIALQLDFNYHHFAATGDTGGPATPLLIQYDGVNRPLILSEQQPVTLP